MRDKEMIEKPYVENHCKNFRYKGYQKGTEWTHGVKEGFIYLLI